MCCTQSAAVALDIEPVYNQLLWAGSRELQSRLQGGGLGLSVIFCDQGTVSGVA